MFAILRSFLRPAKRLNIPFVHNFSSKWQYSSRAGLTQYTLKICLCCHSQVIKTHTKKLSSKKMFEDNLTKQVSEH